MGAAHTAAKDGEVLGIDKDQPPIDCAVSGDHAVAGDPALSQAKIAAVVRNEHVDLAKTAFVEQQFQPLPRRHAAFGMLPRNALLAAAQLGRGFAGAQFLNLRVLV